MTASPTLPWHNSNVPLNGM